jgi:hypothetical protein
MFPSAGAGSFTDCLIDIYYCYRGAVGLVFSPSWCAGVGRVQVRSIAWGLASCGLIVIMFWLMLPFSSVFFSYVTGVHYPVLVQLSLSAIQLKRYSRLMDSLPFRT